MATRLAIAITLVFLAIFFTFAIERAHHYEEVYYGQTR